jgi:hypothetical protein
MPCSEKRARKLLGSRRARVHRLYPFAIRLGDRRVEDCVLHPLRLSLDPGSKTTGLGLCRIETPVEPKAGEIGGPVMHIAFLMELVHRDILARSTNGSDRVGNLTLVCRPCHQTKGALDVREFLAQQPERLKRILAVAKAPLRDAAAANSMRWALFHKLKASGLPVETGSGGRTKFNRTRRGIPKTHALDAACVGVVGGVRGPAQPTLTVQCTGHGSRQRTRVNPSGFPVGCRMRPKSVHGLRTGDRVVASVPARSKRVGDYAGRGAVRASGSFNLPTPHGVVQGISRKHCRVVQRADGYGYSLTPAPTKERKREAGHAVA